jgi:hypothetical protein
MAANIDEIMTSTRAVKGEMFANAVAANFEAVQLMEAVGRLASLAPEEASEYVSSLVDNSQNILASIISKACGDLTDDQLREAIAVCNTLTKRRTSAVDAIRKGMYR